MKDILIVIDMQNDFIEGVLGTAEAKEIVPKIKARIEAHKGDVIFTRDTHGKDYLSTREGEKLPVEHCIKDTYGWQIHDELKDLRAAEVIDKPTFGSVELAGRLCTLCEGEEIKVTLVGVCTDICVISNAMLIKAFLPEVSVSVESDLCAGVTKNSHENALRAMKMCHINII